MKSLFNRGIEERIFMPLDVQFAYSIADENNPILLVVAALLSAETMTGHVCLALSDVTLDNLFSGRHQELANDFWQRMGQPDKKTLYQAVQNAHAVSLTSENSLSPLLLSGDYLYFQRMWQYEQCVAHSFSNRSVKNSQNQQIQSVLDTLFPISESIDWQ